MTTEAWCERCAEPTEPAPDELCADCRRIVAQEAAFTIDATQQIEALTEPADDPGDYGHGELYIA